MNLGTAIDDLYLLRQQKAELDKQKKDLQCQIDEAEEKVTQLLNDSGVTLSRGETATASITEMAMPQVEDWDLFYEHILESGDFHLLERRPASRPYRELLEAGIEIPGLRTFTKRSLSIRTN